MQRKTDTFLNDRWKRILIVISAFLLTYLVLFLLDPFSPYWFNYFDRDWLDILGDWSSSLFFCLAFSEFSIIISNSLNNKVLWTEQPTRRFLIEAGLNLAVIFVVNLVINFLYVYFGEDGQVLIIDIDETRGIIQWFVVSTFIAIVIIGINTGNYLVLNWKNAALRATELKQVAVEAELQSLKLQIDPHFVFNNLSVLSELILEDQKLGYEYAENFSKIYRYMLVNSKKNTIPLEDELKFLDSYIFLIQQRFGEAIKFETKICEEYRKLSMPPLTLQLLVENALKHNKTNKKEPLKVCIYTNDQRELIVRNTLILMESPLESSGIGIKNIIRRYNLLSDKEPSIVNDGISYKVILPLLNV